MLLLTIIYNPSSSLKKEASPLPKKRERKPEKFKKGIDFKLT